MGEIMDLKKSVVDLKADERMIAFAGFSSRSVDPWQGVLKISAFYRADGSGYLTFTFIVDSGPDAATRLALQQNFQRVTDEALRKFLGAELEMLVSAPLGALAQIPDWYLEEYSLYCRKLKDREKWLLEERMLPAFRSVLGLSFDAVEWWLDQQDDRVTGSGSGAPNLRGPGANSLFQRWFGKN